MRWHVDGYGLLSTQISLSCFVRTQIETHSTHLTGELQHLAFFGGRVISHITYLHAGLTVEMRPLPKLSAISPYKVKKKSIFDRRWTSHARSVGQSRTRLFLEPIKFLLHLSKQERVYLI